LRGAYSPPNFDPRGNVLRRASQAETRSSGGGLGAVGTVAEGANVLAQGLAVVVPYAIATKDFTESAMNGDIEDPELEERLNRRLGVEESW